MLRHYTLSEDDLKNIGARRRHHNKLGFALQLGVFTRRLVPVSIHAPGVGGDRSGIAGRRRMQPVSIHAPA